MKTQKSKVKNNYNYVHKDEYDEVNDMPSVTREGMVLTVQDMLIRHISGQSPLMNVGGIYTEAENFEDLEIDQDRENDQFDIINEARKAKDYLAEVQKKQKKATKKEIISDQVGSSKADDEPGKKEFPK